MSILIESPAGNKLPPLKGIDIPISNKDIAIKNLRQLFDKWINETGQCTESEQILITNFIDWIEKK